ncbi:hypothetical protein LINPERHAP2_LOCUS35969, partial [Linum perenne]
VVSEEWRPNFELGYSQVNTIRAWIRLPGLPLENFDVGILKLIGNKIGKTVRVDGTTLFGSRGNYARMYVEIDLHKPLVSKYRLHRRVHLIEYEGLHEIYFLCGRYDHGRKACSLNSDETAGEHTESAFSNPLFQEEKVRPELEDDFGPWMMAKKNVRRQKVVNPTSDDSTAKKGVAEPGHKGSRLSTLDNLEGEEESVEGLATKKAERKLDFLVGEIRVTPSGMVTEPLVQGVVHDTVATPTPHLPEKSVLSLNTDLMRDQGSIPIGSQPKDKESMLLNIQRGGPHGSQGVAISGAKEKETRRGVLKARPTMVGPKAIKIKEGKRVEPDGKGEGGTPC